MTTHSCVLHAMLVAVLALLAVMLTVSPRVGVVVALPTTLSPRSEEFLVYTGAETALRYTNVINPDVALGRDTLESCGSNDDIFIPRSFSVSPDPPLRGHNVTVAVEGDLHDDILPGARIRLKVKLGLITLAVLHFDFCEKAQEFGQPCPLKKGPLTVEHTAAIPSEVPPGRYTVDINIDSVGQRQITCVRANVRF